MSDCLELQEFSVDRDEAFKSCENQLLKDSVLNEEKADDVLTADNVSGENCQEISTCHDLNCADHSSNELFDNLSNSILPIQKPDFPDMPLDDIPLTEEGNINDLLEILPENIPNDKVMLLKIPERLQNSALLNNILNIELDQSIIDEIDKAVKESAGAFLNQPDTVNGVEEVQVAITRRPPLQLIQQVITYPAVKNLRVEEDLKKSNKRKQHFQFPREDRVEFYSDEENNENSQKQAVTVNEDGPSSPKKTKLDESIIEAPIIEEKSTEISSESPKIKKKTRFNVENCPRCDKSIKKLSMHKCRDSVNNNGSIKKLKPSDVPLPLKCDSCKSFFADNDTLEKHRVEKHSQLNCKVCNKVMKNSHGLTIHSAKCGVDIQPVKKLTPKNARNKK